MCDRASSCFKIITQRSTYELRFYFNRYFSGVGRRTRITHKTIRKGAQMTAPASKQKFAEYLKLYKIEPTDGDEEVSYKVLECAYDLFCALDTLAKNHNAMKAKILNILQPKEKDK